MGKFKDLTGQRFGRLVVVKRAEDHVSISGKHYIQWLCKCDCGNESIIIGDSLKCGSTKSCGCLLKEVAKKSMHDKTKKYNTYDLSGEYGIGYTLKGEEFYFDLEDYDLIKNHCWHINEDGYVKTNIDSKHVFMHRLIMGSPNGLVIDHRYGKNTRNDNRKYNLRICTQHENTMNRAMSINNTSGIKGVTWDKHYNKWNAYITVNYKKINLGYFKKIEDAVKIRKESEEKYFGEFNYKRNYKNLQISVDN